MDAILFGCYLVIIWLAGKIRERDFYFLAWATFFALFVSALFSTFMQIYYHLQALTSLRSYDCYVLGNYVLHFSRTLLHDILAYASRRHILGRWKFHQIYSFCHFLRKVSRGPHFLFQYFEVFKTDFNKMWKSEKCMEPSLPFEAHQYQFVKLPLFVW